MRLTIELVPLTGWGKNLRSLLKPAEWNRVRQSVYVAANHKCEICGGVGSRWPVECHEIWDYDDTKRVQRLAGLVALCPNCHMVKHIGLAMVKGRGDVAIAHFARVNGITESEAATLIESAFDVWRERSATAWTLDVSWLVTYNANLPR